ncbi:MAG: peptide chain release factor N(5)-glutamine methyltransferase [Anaerolineae bacterium]
MMINEPPPTIRALLEFTASRLKSDTPYLDAQVLLAHIAQQPRSWLLAHPEASLSTPELEKLHQALSRLESGEPLPYVLGHWEFFGLDFVVTPDVLIPRPETELLVERAIGWLQAHANERPRPRVVDVGTGCGCIAIAIATHLPTARLLATDISYPALRIARQNARNSRLHQRIDFLQCDLLPPPPHGLPTALHFDLICANLPYLPTQTLRCLPIYGREPTLALNGGEDGLDLIRRLLTVVPRWLKPGGRIMLEIEASQGSRALSLAYDTFSEAEIHLHKDLAGHDRLVEIQLTNLP